MFDGPIEQIDPRCPPWKRRKTSPHLLKLDLPSVLSSHGTTHLCATLLKSRIYLDYERLAMLPSQRRISSGAEILALYWVRILAAKQALDEEHVEHFHSETLRAMGVP